MKKIVLLLSVLLPLIFSGCSKNKQNSESVVNIAIQPSAAFIPLYVARYKGFIEEALRPMNVKVNWQDFESGPKMNDSLTANLSDIAVIGDVPTVVSLTSPTQMKIAGIPGRGPNAYAMLALKDNNDFNSIDDIKGKKIATVFGSTGHNLTTKLLKKVGLTFEDIEFISIAASDAEDALTTYLADAVVIWEPNVTRLLDNGIAKVICYGSETDLKGTNAFVVRDDYLITHKEVIKTILEQFERASKIIQNLDDETLKRTAIALQITPEQVKKISKIYDFSIEVTYDDIKSLNDTVKFLIDIGNLSTTFNVESKVVVF